MNKHTPQELFSNLSPRQKEVLRLVCQGTAYKEIAELLIVTESTVKSHMRAVYDKLDLFHLNRDDRIYRIRSIYCPMFEGKPEEIPEVVIEILDPEIEPEPITPEEDELLMSDQSAMIALYQNPPIQTIPSEKRKGTKRRGGCIKYFGFLLILGLAAVGVFFSWQLIQQELGGILPFIPTSEVAPAVPTVGFVTNLPSVDTAKQSSSSASENTYEIGEWHKEGDLWFRVYEVEISDPIFIYFEIWNKSTDDIYFSWTTKQNISLIDNTGTSYKITESFRTKEENVNLPAGTRYDLGRVNYWADPLYEANVTELLFSIEYFSRIEKATWRIPVNK